MVRERTSFQTSAALLHAITTSLPFFTEGSAFRIMRRQRLNKRHRTILAQYLGRVQMDDFESNESSMNKTQDTHFEIKKIGVDNWQLPDTTTELWRTMTRAAKTEDDWVEFFSGPKLNGKVPEEIAKLLEVARGAMIFSWYFYPLATLGTEQCFRLYDTGTRIWCQQLGIPTEITTKKGGTKDTTFKVNIDSLIVSVLPSTSIQL